MGTATGSDTALQASVSENSWIRTCRPDIPQDSSEFKEELNEILASFMLSNFSRYSKQLEQRLRELLNASHALTVPNATTALDMLLSTLPEGSDVLVPSFTFASTIHAVVRARLRPNFVDIEPETFNICPRDAATKITQNTSAILAVNAFGNPCRIDELQALAKKHHLKLFFDSAAAIGSRFRGRLLGVFGDAEVFSMSGTKIVTAGEGGFITTNDDTLAEELDYKRNYGYSKRDNDCLYVGFNGKLNELNAMFALHSLPLMDSNIAWRQKMVAIYREQLESIPGIEFQQTVAGCQTNYCTFAVKIDSEKFGLDASSLRERLNRQNIETMRYFSPPMHKTRAYKEYNDLKLPNTETLAERVLCLPMHSHLTMEQAETVCQALRMIHFSSISENSKHRISMHDGNGFDRFSSTRPELPMADAATI